jgi:hypothetical protein
VVGVATRLGAGRCGARIPTGEKPSIVGVVTRLGAGRCRVRIPLGNGKVTTIPVQAWTSLEGSRRFRLSDFQTVGT